MSWVIGIDVGGTFTDIYAFNNECNQRHIHKTPSTPDNPADAILIGLAELSELYRINLADVERLACGTTVATNVLIQKTGSPVALITTKGFRDLIEIGRQTRPDLYNLQLDAPAPLAPRKFRYEVSERIGPNGEIITPLDRNALIEIVSNLRLMELKSCAVCFLFSFLNGEHERAVGEILRAEIPNMHVSLSSEVHPEYREYERFSSTVLNAYLQPTVSDYIGTLKSKLSQHVPNAHLGIYQSSGGLMSIEHAEKFPVRTALSGPAAGAVGAAYIAKKIDQQDVLTLDVGGTSADVVLIKNSELGVRHEQSIAGFSLRLPTVDINTVGAGGGSVAWIGKDGLLKVGPKSTGSIPGPACYGRGGNKPTVTDANLLLGRLSQRGLLNGKMLLNTDLAMEAIKPICSELGMSWQQVSFGLIEIVTANMVRAIRSISTERGYDPRACALMAFGGAGPLHASGVARALGISTVIIPLTPGILCAHGLIVSDIKENFVSSMRLAVNGDIDKELSRPFDQLCNFAYTWCENENVHPENSRFFLSLEMRYSAQNYELTVPACEWTGDNSIPKIPRCDVLKGLFCDEHERIYGYSNETDSIEIVNMRIATMGKLQKPSISQSNNNRLDAKKEIATESRAVFFSSDIATKSSIYNRKYLKPGDELNGPAIIDQFDSTTVIFPKDKVIVDDQHNLIITIV